jgi:glycerate 2-kinase
MRALIAFDKFRDSISATEACAVAASALRRIKPGWQIDLCPVSDGSLDFVSILTQYRSGELVYGEVLDPHFKPIEAHIGLVDASKFSLSSKAWLRLPDKGRVVLIEIAQASGLQLLRAEERNPWYASSYGTGQLISMALALNPELIIIGMGGSATHDLGLGALEALGLRFRAENGDLLQRLIPAQWSRVVALEGELPSRLPRIILAPNTPAKLLGKAGAAALFGAQKGLRAEDIQKMEEQTQRMAELIISHFGKPAEQLMAVGGGAAGGLGIGLQAAFEAESVPGIALADRWLRLNQKIDAAQVIITGGGRVHIDAPEGRAAQYIVERASGRGKRIYCLANEVVMPDEGAPIPEGLREAKFEEMGGESPGSREVIRKIGDAVRKLAAEIA